MFAEEGGGLRNSPYIIAQRSLSWFINGIYFPNFYFIDIKPLLFDHSTGSFFRSPQTYLPSHIERFWCLALPADSSYGRAETKSWPSQLIHLVLIAVLFFLHTYGEIPHTDFGIGIFPPTDFGIGIFPLQISGVKSGRGISPRETGILARNFQSKSVSKWWKFHRMKHKH